VTDAAGGPPGPPIGVCIRAIRGEPRWWLESARRLDAAGYAGVWCWDHFVGRGDPTVPVVESWTILSMAAAATERVTVGPFVLNVMNRHPAVVARMASMVAQVDAAVALEARQHRQLAPLAAARERTAQVVAAAAVSVRASGAPPTAGSRRVAEASLATARAFQRRLEGDDDPAVWRRVALGWAALDAPYDAALARWRQAEAILAARSSRAGRSSARAPLLQAVELGLSLGTKPLLRELRELAGRARIVLPAGVDTLLDDGRRADRGPADVATGPIAVGYSRRTSRSPDSIASGRAARSSWRCDSTPSFCSPGSSPSSCRRSSSTSCNVIVRVSPRGFVITQ